MAFRSTTLRWAGAMALATSLAAAFVLRTPTLPAPTGPFPIGTISWGLPAPEPRNGKADFAVQAWYPARAETLGTGRDRAFESIQVVWRGLRFKQQYETAALTGAPAAEHEGGFPMIVYVPEWGGGRIGNTALVQDLASHGFVVIAMDPVNGPPGGIGMDFSSPAANAATLASAERLVRAQAHDAVDLLERLTASIGRGGMASPLAGRIDFSRVGIIGFSFGGAVAAQACWADARFKAAVNMDGWLFGDAATAGTAQPFLALSDDSPLPSQADLESADASVRFTSELNIADDRRMAIHVERHGAERIIISGSRHSNFSDLPLVWPVRAMNGAGPAPPIAAFRTISGHVAAFFRKHL